MKQIVSGFVAPAAWQIRTPAPKEQVTTLRIREVEIGGGYSDIDIIACPSCKYLQCCCAQLKAAKASETPPSGWARVSLANSGRAIAEGAESWKRNDTKHHVLRSTAGVFYALDGDRFISQGFKSLTEAAQWVDETRPQEASECTADKPFAVGDLVMCTYSTGGSFTKGRVYRVRETETRWGTLGIQLDDGGSITNGMDHKHFRLVAADELPPGWNAMSSARSDLGEICQRYGFRGVDEEGCRVAVGEGRAYWVTGETLTSVWRNKASSMHEAMAKARGLTRVEELWSK